LIQVLPVILCGGSGSRLWSLSRSGFPKKFLALTGKESLFHLAALRLHALANNDIAIARSLIVTNEEHRFLAQEQLRELGSLQASFVLEPAARNTAAALTLAALEVIADGADPILVASPADQNIGDEVAYVQCVRKAIALANAGGVVILGIPPDRPETGYGYIQFSKSTEKSGQTEGHRVLKFVEKPSLDVAQTYIASGDFAWSSGMFVLKASTWLKALSQFRPDILQVCQTAWNIKRRDDLQMSGHAFSFVRPDPQVFAKVPSESVDYAVLEKCSGSAFDIHMVPLLALCSDLGAWDAVWQAGQADAQGNVSHGDVMLEGASNTYVHASSRLVSAVGVKDLVIVETADAVLVIDKANSQQVKKIVNRLEASKRQERNLHRKVHRPWKWYDSLDEGERFKVKRILVKPGASPSLQKHQHQHRAEHWIVVKGTAEVTCGDKVIVLTESQSTYIHIGEVHRLSNKSDTDLEIIEVQTGGYLREDDIIRLQDTYERAPS
jgi:mannose-1-phosphate guanylyltransferase / mannose-6-phosphate isomerase